MGAPTLPPPEATVLPGIFACPPRDLDQYRDQHFEQRLEQDLGQYLDEEPARWEDLPARGWVADAIAESSLPSMNEDGLLSAVVALERVSSWLAAVQARVLSEFATRRSTGSDNGEFAGEEIAAALHVAPRTGVKRLDRALELTDRLPQTLEYMERGEATVAQACVLADETAHLPTHLAHEVEAAALPGASTQTPGQLRRAAKEAVFRVDAAAAEHREALARAERKVVISALPDGMAELYALLPAQDAIALYASLDDAARQARRAGDPRSMDQLRADTLAALAGTPGGRASVQIILTDATLAGRDDAPAELIGSGPISAATARQIAADGIWQALRIDETGALTGVGRHRYRPSAGLAELIRSRDRTCRFPGCAHPARTCDIDHTRRFPVGATESANLASLCRRHHRLKTRGEWEGGERDDGESKRGGGRGGESRAGTGRGGESKGGECDDSESKAGGGRGGGWSVTQHPGGSLTWRSPTGRTYLTNPRRLTDIGPPAAPSPASGDPPF